MRGGASLPLKWQSAIALPYSFSWYVGIKTKLFAFICVGKDRFNF
jgi:hypothetical protein